MNTRTNVRRLLGWSLLLVIALLAAIVFRSLNRSPKAAWDHPADVRHATFPPRIRAEDRAATLVPVWLFRPHPDTQPDWADYLAEILRSEGVTLAVVGCDRLESAIPASVHALVIPAECDGVPPDRLRSFVEAGGTVVAVGCNPALMGLLGARMTPMPSSAIPGNGDLAHLEGGVLAPSCHAEPENADTRVLLWYDEETSRTPLLLERRAGKGIARMWCADMARSIARTRQGNPTLTGTSGLLPHPSPGDLFQADFDAKRYATPVADTWMHELGRSVVSGHTPIPVFWPFPRPDAAAAILTGDQDYAPDKFIDYQLAHVENAGGEMTLFLTSVTRATQTAAPDDIPVQSPDPDTVRAWRALHHHFSIHPNANGLPRDPAILVKTIEASRRAMIERYGIVPRTIRHHFTFWWGYVGTARALARLGFLMDFNYLSIVPGRSGEGWLHGAGLPLPFVDLDGTVLPIFQQPTQVEDSLLMSDLAFSAGLDEQEAVRLTSRLIFTARHWGTALTFNFHPLYSVKTPAFLDGLLSAIQDARLPMLSAERWLDLVLRRYEARVERVTTTSSGGGIAVSFDLTIPSGTLWVRLPDASKEGPCNDIVIDGKPVATQRTAGPEPLAGTLFPANAGTHHVVARCERPRGT